MNHAWMKVRNFITVKTRSAKNSLKKELPAELLPTEVICPNCSSELELSDEDRASKKFHCPECESLIDFNVNPPRILNPQNYSLLLSSLNQGDIALIKSILENSNHYCPVVEGEKWRNTLSEKRLSRNSGVFDLKMREAECYPFGEE
ncbi:MAG: hypothetical protein M1470_08655, partial [Bacteroidetes bacterium]|nr:hypothetical protein [Bacteroidota bacterium]MCL5737947.1 hypothetical protein [Bacteroidota bacterium]